MELFLILVIWIPLSIAISVAAHARGRGAVAWFLTALLFSPLIAIILLIAFPAIPHEEDLDSDGAFEAEAAFAGIPYRVEHDGRVTSMMGGGLVSFRSIEAFKAAALSGKNR